MRAHAFALELRSGSRDHVLHGEAELLLQLLQRRRRTERLHADARALGPDVTIPPEPARLLHGYPSRDVGRNHAVPIGLRLLLEQLPRRHAGLRSRVVRLPAWELGGQAPQAYRD